MSKCDTCSAKKLYESGNVIVCEFVRLPHEKPTECDKWKEKQ